MGGGVRHIDMDMGMGDIDVGVYFKKLAHIIVGADQVEMNKTDRQAGNSYNT